MGVRRLIVAISIALTVTGAVFTWEQFQLFAQAERAADRRLKPDTPLVPAAAVHDARLGAKLARLRIPSIGVDEVVVEGVRPRDLAVGIGHYPSTGLPGEPGVVGLAGHRTGWGDPLFRLDELKPGDRIVLRTAGRRFVYEVTRSIVVDPGKGEVLEGDPRSKAEQRLAITTCTPAYTSLRRLVVWADRVS